MCVREKRKSERGREREGERESEREERLNEQEKKSDLHPRIKKKNGTLFCIKKREIRFRRKRLRKFHSVIRVRKRDRFSE